MKKNQVILNKKIVYTFSEVTVISSEGKSLGVMPSRDALDLAQNEGLDLLLVSSGDKPVCKIVDHGKLKYQEEKSKAFKHKQETKEVKISPRIQQHDLETFTKRAIKFLTHGDKVKLTCVFRHPELQHPEFGKQKIDAFLEIISEYGLPEGDPVLNGKNMSLMINPIKK